VQVNDIATATATLSAVFGAQLNGGSIVWTTAADVVLGTSILDASSPFTIVNGVATLNHGGSAVSGTNVLTSSANIGVAQTVAKAKFLKADSTLVTTMTVGTSLSDIIMQNTLIGTGESCQLVGLSVSPN
jgi:hypothetical protein